MVIVSQVWRCKTSLKHAKLAVVAEEGNREGLTVCDCCVLEVIIYLIIQSVLLKDYDRMGGRKCNTNK